MPEIGHAMKRKSWESKNESTSADSVWVSSSSSGPKPRIKRPQHDGKSRDGSKPVEGEPLRPTISCAAGKGKLRCVNSDEEAIPINNTSHHKNISVANLRREAMECLTAKDEPRTGRKDLQPALISLNTVRTCMEALIGELREARTRMLQWMREEMLSMLHEAPATPRACTRSLGELSGENMDLEEQVLQLDSALTSSPSVSLMGAQFGGESNRRGELRFSRQVGEAVFAGGLESAVESNDGSGGVESCDQSSVPGDSSLRMHDAGDVGEDMNVIKQNVVTDQRILVSLAGQNSAHRDTGGSVCYGRFGNDKEETRQSSVASVDYRTNALGGFETQNEQGRIDFSLGNDICRNHGEHNFQGQSDICGDLGFGAESGNNGALAYGGSSDCRSLMYFGLHCGNQTGEFRGSLNNTSLENNQIMPFRVSNEDKTPDLVGLQSQAEAVELQNAGTPNMVWNMMQQGGGNLNQRACDAVGRSFKYDEIVKSSGTTMGNGITYANSSRLFRSVTPQNTVSVPMRSASHCFNSVDLPTLITLQNQMVMQSPSTLQNFLDLNVGVGINKQMFPSVYFQESEVSISPNLSLAHKRGSELLSLDMLNT